MKKLVVLFACILLFACQSETVEKPANLIPEDKMVDILHDLALIDAIKSSNPRRLQQDPNAATYIYRKYKIDSLQFANSNRYYAADMEKYTQLFEQVRERVTAAEKAASKQAPAKDKPKPAEGGVVN